MISAESQAVAEKSTALYESQLRANLEEAHRGKYVSIEPLSGRYFLGDSFDEAVNAALDECRGCLTHTLRIGHTTAIHLGVLVK